MDPEHSSSSPAYNNNAGVHSPGATTTTTPTTGPPQLLHQRHRPSPHYYQYPTPYQSSSSGAYTSDATATSNYSYSAASAGPSPTRTTTTHFSSTTTKAGVTYAHNGVVAVLLVPSLYLLLYQFDSSAPRTMLACWAMILYALDLANLRTMSLVLTCLATLVQGLWCGWTLLLESDDDDDNGLEILLLMVQLFAQFVLLVTLSCWITLQMQWLQKRDESSGATASTTTLSSMEHTVHGILPLAASCVLTMGVCRYLEVEIGRDVAAVATPLVFAVIMTLSMLLLGSACQMSTTTATSHSGQHDSHDDNAKAGRLLFCVPPAVAYAHMLVLLLGPPLMHVCTSVLRLVRFSVDDVAELVIVMTLPCLCLYGLHVLPVNATRGPRSPYHLPRLSALLARHSWLPLGVVLAASLALQQRFLVPWCHRIAYHLLGTTAPSWLVSTYWTLATVSLLGASWLWGRTTSPTFVTAANGGINTASLPRPLLGEYQEDIVQLLLCFSGLALGKAIGLPWNMVPLPILAFLGLALWLATRMLRYLSICLFVVHAAGVLVFTYRFAAMTDLRMDVPVLGGIVMSMGLLRFATVVVLSSILVGSGMGLAVRSAGGYGFETMRRFDVTGCLFALYSLVLTILEISLTKRPVPSKELAGFEVEADEFDENEALYSHAMAFTTSTVMISLALFMKKVRIVSAKTAWLIVSIAAGKAAAFYIDMQDWNEEGESTGSQLLTRCAIASVGFVVIFTPRVFLQPVHIKASSSRRSLNGASGHGGDLPAGASRMITFYAFVLVPTALVIAIPYVLLPLANALGGDNNFGRSYYNVRQPLSELVGSAISLWGLACLSMLNYYLPDGGGEVWKKLSALAFVFGITISFAAPTVGVNLGQAADNPYAALSSIGSQLIDRGKSRTGGWGLVTASMATLLAMTGPLELKERALINGRKDKMLLFRTMIFSVLFGGGVAWFIVMQSMSEVEWIYLFLTLVACMAIAFLGTIVSVLGYFIELDNFDEVEQMLKILFTSMILLLPVIGFPQLARANAANPFGAGGWLATYLAVASLSTFAFTLAVRSRSLKNTSSRGFGNLCCLLSWTLALVLLYGRFGVAGLDANFDVRTSMGVPISILGTIVVAPMLTALEGEAATRRAGTGRSRGVNGSGPASATSIPALASAFTMPNLTKSNWLVPSTAAIVLVYLVSTVYVIFLRGSPFMTMLGLAPVARSHEDVFAKVFGDNHADVSRLDLATMAQKTLLQSKALASSAKLASAGLWTASNILGPVWHVAGVLAVVPGQYLYYHQFWWKRPVAASLLLLVLPLHVVPLILCRGIPTLRYASALAATCNTFQLVRVRQADHQSKMTI